MGVTPSCSEGAADKETKPRPTLRVHSGAIGVAALAAFVVILAACGGGGSKTTATASAGGSTTTAPANSNRTAQRQAFTQCMQSHGIKTANLPRRAFGGGGGENSGPNSSGGSSSTGPTTSFTLPPGVTRQQMQSALQACRSLLPAGGRNFQNNPAFAAYRNCLQLHGVTIGTGGAQGLDRSNPTVQSAMQACAALRPSPSSSTSTPPST